MATAPNVPRHITKPLFVRNLLAAHHSLDIAAWITSSGKEVLYIKGKAQDVTNPKQEVFDFRRVTDRQVIECIRVLFRINLLEE
jgi:hypothetical protein